MPKQASNNSLRIAMTKHNEDQQIQLNELYQRRKSAYKVPSSIKRRILHAANKKEDSNWLNFNFLNWTRGISLAAATAFLLRLIAIQRHDIFWPKQNNQQVQVVEIHTLADESQSLSENIQIKYAKNYQQYLQKQEFSALHHRKKALLNITRAGWELSTCNLEIVKVSRDVLQALSNLERIERSLRQGDHVDIYFNHNGNIIAISEAKDYRRC